MLRHATRRAHEGTDLAFSCLNLRTRRDGITFLKAHYLAFHQVEARLADAPQLPPLPPRTGLIAADLTSLGSIAPRPQRLSLPEVDPLGFAYVVAGSHFGARQLLSTWMSSSDHQHQQATRYLSDSGLGTFWRALQPLLSAPASAGNHDHLIGSARLCFRLFDDALAAVQGRTSHA